MTALKTEAVSVRVEPRIKAALQTALEREMRSVANMVEATVVAYCRANACRLVDIPDETLIADNPGLSPL